MTTTKTLNDKMLQLQIAAKANKNSYNEFGKYNYRTGEQILSDIKPKLLDLNLLISLNDEMHLIGDRYYIKATVTITDIDSNEAITATAYAREAEALSGMTAAQITGAASSYARKYALTGLLAISETDDADDVAAKTEPEAKKTAARTTAQKPPAATGQNTTQKAPPGVNVCSVCGVAITEKVAKYSTDKYKKPLCMQHQPK